MGTSQDELVRTFVSSTIGQYDCFRKGDSRTGNRHADRRRVAFEKLAALGAKDALLPLLDHEHVEVRVAAAGYLLRHRHAEARSVLEAIAAGEGFAAFEAAQTLRHWENGTWQIDLPNK